MNVYFAVVTNRQNVVDLYLPRIQSCLAPLCGRTIKSPLLPTRLLNPQAVLYLLVIDGIKDNKNYYTNSLNYPLCTEGQGTKAEPRGARKSSPPRERLVHKYLLNEVIVIIGQGENSEKAVWKLYGTSQQSYHQPSYGPFDPMIYRPRAPGVLHPQATILA